MRALLLAMTVIVLSGFSSASSSGLDESRGALAAAGSPLGACCDPDGSCRIVTEADCYQGGGASWLEGANCDNACPPTGSCCLPEGSCALLIEISCVRDGGFFQGEGEPCNEEVCRSYGRRCYIGNQGAWKCMRSAAACARAGGRWSRDEICLLNGRGACCLPDGSCSIETFEDCQDQGGIFQGDEVPCDVETCPPASSGSCCHPDGSCEILSESECYSSGGIDWIAAGTCEDADCPPTGACCLSDGACVLVLELACENLDGSFQGTDVPCESEVCPPVPTEPRSWGSIKSLYR